MSYVKTQWVNNTTPINDTNLNKIEQGIYDNSLVTEAIEDKLNPTDTETYKTAELTEGQITDVIGVNDIVIKGDTEQDGEPTPSSPVDVNVVSGSNVINTSSKNLLDGVSWTKNYALNENNTAFSANGWEYSDYVDVTNANYYYSSTTDVHTHAVAKLMKDSPVPATYAGGISSFDDIEVLRSLGGGKVDFTVGSALDIFGGSLPFDKIAGYTEG